MSQQEWNAVEQYIGGHLLAPDPVLEATLQSIRDAGMPEISVAPNDGKLLQLLARLARATRILEIGTLGGYSTIWLARALPEGGKLISLEYVPLHAQVAADNIARAGLSDKVEIRVGRAADILPLLEAEGGGPFDMVFIDADKPSNAEYIRWALLLTRPGSLIIVDNVVRHGRVVDADSDDPSVAGTRALFELLAAEPGLSATAIQTVGSKGWDGMAIMLVD